MIRPHAFNSDWWGGPAGIVDDDAFFRQPAAARAAALDPYDWVEHRPKPGANPVALAAAGFVLVDQQIPFRIALPKVPVSPSLDALSAVPATEAPIHIAPGDMRPFRHERFSCIPGVTPERLAERYARWAATLVASEPGLCLSFAYEGRPQGWFLSRRAGSSLHLTLAMLHRDATVSGALLYQKALVTHAARGERLGEASFSASNSDVLNIYARFGAHFLPAEPCFLWIHPRCRPDTP